MREVLIKIKGGYFVRDGRWSYFISDDDLTEEEMVNAISKGSLVPTDALEKYPPEEDK